MNLVALEESLLERADPVWAGSPLPVKTFQRGAEDEALQLNEAGARVFIIGTHRYPDEFYRALQGPCLIQRMGIGCGNVPRELCHQLGHRVARTSGTLENAVAEHALALMLACAKRVVELDRSMRRTSWQKRSGLELRGRTLGLIGFGQIAGKLARMAKEGLGMRILAQGRSPTLRQELEGAAQVDDYTTDMDLAFARSDVVSIHLPGTAATRRIVNAGLLAQLKPGAILINTGRGEVLDEGALYQAFHSGSLAAAGLDVFEYEPYTPQASRDLRKLENVVLSPHCASCTEEANQRSAELCLAHAVAFYSGNPITFE